MLKTSIKKTLVILGNVSLILSMTAGLMGCSTASATSSSVETEKDTKAPVITLKSDTYKIELGSKYDLNENVKSVIDDVDGKLKKIEKNEDGKFAKYDFVKQIDDFLKDYEKHNKEK